MDVRSCEVCHLGIEGGRLIAFLDVDGWHVLHGDCFQARASSAAAAGVSSAVDAPARRDPTPEP